MRGSLPCAPQRKSRDVALRSCVYGSLWALGLLKPGYGERVHPITQWPARDLVVRELGASAGGCLSGGQA